MGILMLLFRTCILAVICFSCAPIVLGDSFSPSWVMVYLEDENGNKLTASIVDSKDGYQRIKEFELILGGKEYALCKAIKDRLLFPYLNEISIRYDSGITFQSGNPVKINLRYLEFPIGGYIDANGLPKEDFDAELYAEFLPMSGMAYKIDVISKKNNNLLFSINSNECN